MSRRFWALLGGVVLVDRSRLLDSQQPDECHTFCFARPNACRALVSSRPYCPERRAIALTFAPGRAGGRRPSRSDCAARS